MISTRISPVTKLDAPAAQRLLAGQNVVLIDVREACEFARERIAGARLLPLAQLDAGRIAQIAQGKQIVVCCASGNRSQSAIRKLSRAGLTDIAHLEGGIAAWKAAGLPLEEDRSAPLPIMRQVQIVAGTLVFAGTSLGALVSPWFLLIPASVGAGLVFSGASGSCMMAHLLAKLPYNRTPQVSAPEQKLA